jgi:hypothetical protein
LFLDGAFLHFLLNSLSYDENVRNFSEQGVASMELEEKGPRTNARRIQRRRVSRVVCGLMLIFGILASNQALSSESVPSETPEAQQTFVRILSPEGKDVHEFLPLCRTGL